MSGRAFYCETNSEFRTFAEEQAKRIAQLEAALLRLLEAGNALYDAETDVEKVDAYDAWLAADQAAREALK